MFRWFGAVAAIFGWVTSLMAKGFVISTLAGGAPPSTLAGALQMAIAPQGTTPDTSGNLYFISSNRVFKRDLSGAVTRVAGNSRQGYAGDGGPALTAEFNSASGSVAKFGLQSGRVESRCQSLRPIRLKVASSRAR
jgi:hypothetical protein